MYLFGVDIGGTCIKVVILKNSICIDKYLINTNLNYNGGNILKDVSESIIDYCMNSKIDYNLIEAIGIGVPGPVVNGVVSFCVNLNWEEKDVVKELSMLLPFDTVIGCLNDANATLYAEVNNEYNTAAILTIGTGIGGGVYINGVVEGVTGSSGEFGHIYMDNPYNFKCNCGLNNCLETVASATGICNIYRFKTNNELDCKSIFDKIEENDIIALEVLEEVCMYLGKACANIAVNFNPEVIIIGGGVSLAGDILLDGIRRYFVKYCFKSVKETKIINSTLGNDSGGIGVALYAKEKRECISKSKI